MDCHVAFDVDTSQYRLNDHGEVVGRNLIMATDLAPVAGAVGGGFLIGFVTG